MERAELRVAMLAPISWRVPPRHYGPWEQFVSLLTEGLVARGVDVTLFAAADSVTSARWSARSPRGIRRIRSWIRRCGRACTSRRCSSGAEFDLIHNNFDFLPLTYSGLVETPVVTTIHGFSSEKIVPVFERYDARGHYVAISDADRHPKPRLRSHDPPRHPDGGRSRSCATPGDYLLVLRADPSAQGRGRGDRGRRARRAAAGDGRDRAGPGVLRACRGAAHRRRRVRYIGSVGPEERGAVLGGARALLHLIRSRSRSGSA